MTKQLYPCEGFPHVSISRNPAFVNPNTRFVVHEKALPLIEELHKHRPQWALISANVNITSETVAAHHFDIYESGQSLGEISIESGYRADIGSVTYYRFDNPRLSRKRQRGIWSKTSKLDLAVKSILKAFHGKTLNESIIEYEQAITTKLSGNTHLVNKDFDAGYRRISPFVTQYVMDNWGAVAPALKAMGAPVPEDMPKRLATRNEAEGVELAYRNQQGFTIITRGSDYIMVRGFGDERETEVKSSEQLTDNIRRNLGFLKLHEGSQIIPNVGVRLNDHAFFVMDKEPV
jgi:hypothetical protein